MVKEWYCTHVTKNEPVRRPSETLQLNFAPQAEKYQNIDFLRGQKNFGAFGA